MGFLQVVMQLLPIILKLLDKSQMSEQERADSVSWAESLTRAAVRSGDWKGILVAGLTVRAAKMDDATFTALAADIEQLQAAMAAAVAEEG
jgi:hypothetical protein